MRVSWLSYALWVVTCAILEPVGCNPLPSLFGGGSKPDPLLVFRGDQRDPSSVRGSGPEPAGFFTREPPRQYDAAYSLQNHVLGWENFQEAKVPENFDTKYVSTSEYYRIAKRFANNGYISAI